MSILEIKHFGNPIPLSHDNGIEVFNEICKRIRETITDKELEELETEVKNVKIFIETQS